MGNSLGRVYGPVVRQITEWRWYEVISNYCNWQVIWLWTYRRYVIISAVCIQYVTCMKFILGIIWNTADQDRVVRPCIMTSVVYIRWDERILQIGLYTDIRKRNAVDSFKCLNAYTYTEFYIKSDFFCNVFMWNNIRFQQQPGFICELVYLLETLVNLSIILKWAWRK